MDLIRPADYADRIGRRATLSAREVGRGTTLYTMVPSGRFRVLSRTPDAVRVPAELDDMAQEVCLKAVAAANGGPKGEVVKAGNRLTGKSVAPALFAGFPAVRVALDEPAQLDDRVAGGHPTPVKPVGWTPSTKVYWRGRVRNPQNLPAWLEASELASDVARDSTGGRLVPLATPVGSSRFALVTRFENEAFAVLLPGAEAWISATQSHGVGPDAPGSELQRLLPAAGYMAGATDKMPTLDGISASVRLSPFHFHRRFADTFGMTPKTFLFACQLGRTLEFLEDGQTPLAEVAKLTGFAHQSHFTSRFRQAMNVTPARWRRETLAPKAANGRGR